MTEKEIFERQVEDLMHYGYERHQAVNIVEDGHYQDTIERELYFHDKMAKAKTPEERIAISDEEAGYGAQRLLCHGRQLICF